MARTRQQGQDPAEFEGEELARVKTLQDRHFSDAVQESQNIVNRRRNNDNEYRTDDNRIHSYHIFVD